MTGGGEPVTASKLSPDHTDWAKSSSGGARRRIGGRFLEKGESKVSCGPWLLDREGKRVKWWGFEAVVETEEMDEVGEGGRGMS